MMVFFDISRYFIQRGQPILRIENVIRPASVHNYFLRLDHAIDGQFVLGIRSPDANVAVAIDRHPVRPDSPIKEDQAVSGELWARRLNFPDITRARHESG